MHVVRRFNLVWQLMRPRTLAVVWLHLLFVYLLIPESLPEAWKVVAAFVAIAAWYVHAVAVNDLSDEKVDKLNLVAIGEDGDRPLINGTASSKQAWSVSYAAAFVLLLCCAALVWWLGVIAVIMIGLNMAYSLPPIRISARGGLAQLLLPLGYVGFPACVAVAVAGSFDVSLIMPVVGLYVLFMGRLFLKDIRDETGDRVTGKLTFLVRHGHKLTLTHSAVWSSAGMIIMFVGLRDVQPMLLLAIMLLCMAVLLWNLRACYIEPKLECKLLRVGIVGRAASAWLFSVVVTVALQQYASHSILQILLPLIAVAMFAFGTLALFEELTIIKRRQVVVQQ